MDRTSSTERTWADTRIQEGAHYADRRCVHQRRRVPAVWNGQRHRDLLLHPRQRAASSRSLSAPRSTIRGTRMAAQVVQRSISASGAPMPAGDRRVVVQRQAAIRPDPGGVPGHCAHCASVSCRTSRERAANSCLQRRQISETRARRRHSLAIRARRGRRHERPDIVQHHAPDRRPASPPAPCRRCRPARCRPRPPAGRSSPADATARDIAGAPRKALASGSQPERPRPGKSGHITQNLSDSDRASTSKSRPLRVSPCTHTTTGLSRAPHCVNARR